MTTYVFYQSETSPKPYAVVNVDEDNGYDEEIDWLANIFGCTNVETFHNSQAVVLKQ